MADRTLNFQMITYFFCGIFLAANCTFTVFELMFTDKAAFFTLAVFPMRMLARLSANRTYSTAFFVCVTQPTVRVRVTESVRQGSCQRDTNKQNSQCHRYPLNSVLLHVIS